MQAVAVIFEFMQPLVAIWGRLGLRSASAEA
jgi:hypothetical protein